MAVPGSVEGMFSPPGHVADELSSPSWEMVKDLFPKGPVRCHLGPHHSQPLRLCRPGGVFLPLKDLGSVWLTRVHNVSAWRCCRHFQSQGHIGSLVFISLACSHVLAAVDFYGGTCPRPAQYY